MNPQTLLEQLEPLRAPNPVGWWPLAPGWWVLIALTLIALGALIWIWRQRRERNRYRREALAALGTLAAEGGNTASLNVLLKSVALQVFGSAPAGLSGDAWIEFLTSRCPNVSRETLAPLANVYAPEGEPITPDLEAAVGNWLQHHEVAHV